MSRGSTFTHNLWCKIEKFSQRQGWEYDIRKIDDDLHLAVLKAATTFGIRHCIAVDQPDLSKPPKTVTLYESVTSLDEIRFAS